MKKQNVLICGASGFIGRNIAGRLANDKNFNVFGTYYKTKPDRNFLKKNIVFIRVDLTNKSHVDQVIKGKDIVIQAAAVTSGANDILTKPYLHVTDNAIMNSLIFRSSFEQRVKHLVFFSCSVMYPSQERLVKESDVTYEIAEKYFGVGWTKVYLEKMCEFYSKISKTRYTVIRHSNIYGPYDKFDLDHSHVFGATITKVMRAKDRIVVWGDGSEARDLLYISDLVDFVERVIAKQKISFELLNIGSGSAVSVSALVKKIIKISGKKIQIIFDAKKPTIKFSVALNINKAKKIYQWQPRVTLDEGIQKTINWYTQHIL